MQLSGWWSNRGQPRTTQLMQKRQTRVAEDGAVMCLYNVPTGGADRSKHTPACLLSAAFCNSVLCMNMKYLLWLPEAQGIWLVLLCNSCKTVHQFPFLLFPMPGRACSIHRDRSRIQQKKRHTEVSPLVWRNDNICKCTATLWPDRTRFNQL